MELIGQQSVSHLYVICRLLAPLTSYICGLQAYYDLILICCMPLVGIVAYAFPGNPLKALVAPWLLWQPQGPIDLQWENVCHHHNSLSFNRMFLKLTDKVGKD